MEPNKKKLCVVPVCKNLRFDLVHKFPMRADRAEIWRKALKISDLDDMEMTDIRKKIFVCSRHFLPSDYKNLESRSLNWNAVPSINLTAFDNPNCMDSCTYIITTSTPICNPVRDTHAKVPPAEITKTVHVTIPTLMPSQKLSSSLPSTSTPVITPPSPKVSTIIIPRREKPTNVILGTPSLLPLTKVLKPIAKSPKKLRVTASQLSSLIENLATKKARAITQKPTHHDLRNPQEKKLHTTSPSSPQKRKPTSIIVPVMTMEQNMSGEEEEEKHLPALDLCENVDMSPVMDTLLSVPGLDTKLDFIWLRDHCRCNKCYNHGTNQRRLAIRDIPLDIRANSTKVDGDQLTVNWPDGHVSEYSIKLLSTMLLSHRLASKPTVFTWTKDTIQRFSYARVTMNEYLQDEQVSRSVVQSLVDYGVAFVEKVPPNSTFTEFVIKRLFAIHRTHFGDMWTFSDNNVGFLDTAYTSEPLPAHTDNTYFNDASGLQILHCIEYEATGGQSLLVDGFKVLENVKAKHPEVYERLKKYQVPAENKEKSAHHAHTEPIIIEDPVDGKLQQIRYNIGDRAPMNSLSMSEMRMFYSDLQILAEEVESPANEWWFALKPGTVMFFNNWRLLHGRAEFSGKRVMCGSYVSRNEFMSVARTMGIVP